MIPDEKQKIFIHMRRGDYRVHKCFGKQDITLPLSYYKTQIDWFNKNLDNSFFVFLSDDIEYVKDNFGGIKNKIISIENMNVDFCIMTLCDGGIMSNSTYSWWGAYFMKNRRNLVAPRYWFGFKSKLEYPIGISPSFAKIVDYKK